MFWHIPVRYELYWYIQRVLSGSVVLLALGVVVDVRKGGVRLAADFLQ